MQDTRRPLLPVTDFSPLLHGELTTRQLNLVYNPIGPVLPPAQQVLVA